MKNEKDYKNTFRNIYMFSVIATGFFVIMALASVAGAVGSGISAADNVWTTILMSIEFITLLIVCNFTRLFFRRLSVSDTPFLPDIADKVKGGAIALISGGILYLLLDLLFDKLRDMKYIAVDVVINSDAFSLVAIFAGLVFYAFALVFDYGCTLQQQADETL